GGIDRLRDPQALKGWLATVTVRLAGRRLRARRVRVMLRLDAAPSYASLCAPGADPEERSPLARVETELERLPCDRRVAATAADRARGDRGDRVARGDRARRGSIRAPARRRIASRYAGPGARRDRARERSAAARSDPFPRWIHGRAARRDRAARGPRRRT